MPDDLSERAVAENDASIPSGKAAARPDPNIAGKDYLTTEEAAFFACVSRSQFLKCAPKLGIHPSRPMGVPIYRKTDIQRAFEQSWLQSPFEKIVTANQRTTSSRSRTRPASANASR